MSADIEETRQGDLRDYLRVLRERIVAIAVTVVVVVGLTMAYSFLATPKYTANAKVLIPELNTVAQLNASSSSQLPSSDSVQRTLADEQQLAQGDQVRKAAQAQLGFPGKITIGSSATADILTFTATNTDRAAAATIANAYANSYITTSDTKLAAQYNQEISALRASLAQLQGPGAPPISAGSGESSVATITQSLQQLQAAANLVSQTGPTVVQGASPPSSPSSPQKVRNGILALLVGLVLGVGVAFLRDRFDDGLNSREDAERSTGGAPVIALIPLVDAWRRRGQAHLAMIEDPMSPASEAYRSLRTALQFLRVDNQRNVVGITSSLPEEGKTTTVANLAVSLARAGQRVVVVSCDLRRPRLHAFFQEDNSVGLTSVLLRESSLQDAVQAVPGEPHLRVLPSGPIPPNPTELLTLDRVGDVIDALVKICDVVLVDCPPVLPVSDAILLSRLVDGMLILGAARKTSRRSLARTYELLKQVEAPVLGTVINLVPQSDRHGKGYGYGYEYGYGYGYSSKVRGNDQTTDKRAAGRKKRARAAVREDTLARVAGTSNEDSMSVDGFPDTYADANADHRDL